MRERDWAYRLRTQGLNDSDFFSASRQETVKKYDNFLNSNKTNFRNLKENVKLDKKVSVSPLILDYNPILSDIQIVIQKHAHLLRSSPELLNRFSSISSYQKPQRHFGTI